ncbi:ribonuclease III [Neoactinobaculum massilliense]|uniref:ribonuclease III n=1 Tax=Neoactinobaculum massilliense TaxID=2364794 RepID=UPI000F53049C|nr:ribonuclease III [Neoactinobaculum massilliense]
MSDRELLERWGAEISHPLLRRALTHRSFAYEHDEPHNERLEFLGDSVLGLIIAEKVFREFPHATEGDMSRMKTYAVSEKALADVARALDLGPFIRLGKGEKQSGGDRKDSILSDTVESLIAATYLENGMEVARRVVDRLLNQKIQDASVLGPNLDWQTSFEERAHARGMEGTLEFDITSRGPDHARVFTAVAHMGGRTWGSGEGTSQKHARHKAAEASFRLIAAEDAAAVEDAAAGKDAPATDGQHGGD